MLNITGLVRITRFEDLSDKAVKATVYFGTKKKGNNVKEDEWENSFFNAVVVGEALEKIGEIDEKTPIYITSGIVKNPNYEDREGNQRSYLSLTIFDFEYDEDKIEELIEASKPAKSNEKKNNRNSKTKKNEKPKRTDRNR